MTSRTVGAAGILEQINGAHALLGTITADGLTAKNSSTTAVPFTIPAGQRIELQGDVAFYVVPSPAVNSVGEAGSAATATAANGLLVSAGEKYQFCLRGSQTDVSILGAFPGVCNVKVFSLI